MLWGFIFLFLGVSLILQYYNIIPSDMNLFWPVIFIAIGLSILFDQKDGGCWCNNFWKKKKKK